MAVAFKVQPFSFTNESGPQSQVLTFPFPSNVKEAAAAIGGFRFDFTQDVHPEGHNIDVVQVGAKVTGRTGSTVQVRVACHFADQSRDDQYSGTIDVLVIAEL
jgi:hypothetical protein